MFFYTSRVFFFYQLMSHNHHLKVPQSYLLSSLWWQSLFFFFSGEIEKAIAKFLEQLSWALLVFVFCPLKYPLNHLDQCQKSIHQTLIWAHFYHRLRNFENSTCHLILYLWIHWLLLLQLLKFNFNVKAISTLEKILTENQN